MIITLILCYIWYYFFPQFVHNISLARWSAYRYLINIIDIQKSLNILRQTYVMIY